MEVRGGGADGCPLSLNPAAATEVHHDRGGFFPDETCERVLRPLVGLEASDPRYPLASFFGSAVWRVLRN